MDLNNQKYFLINNLKFNGKFNDIWLNILDLILPKAEFIEFNIYDSKKQLDAFINDWQEEFIEIGRKRNKTYSSGNFIRFKLSERLKEFVASKKIKEWRIYGLEDISFLQNDIEILATITHENYLYLFLTDEEKNLFNKLGLDLKPLLNIELKS
jgi:hypothetical protein